ncbi:hypothetical protein COV20_01635 [Candidatus Woesearchaeota archaeon CG10_big_fil_rev_8_21_14_0_10_45_16]|nr:MAG: hypothetical protein COV20_01635 [Candidatus Woesearchaeota archaeon CG10_big_fil_rev_8_21_14_0_10_45_16]
MDLAEIIDRHGMVVFDSGAFSSCGRPTNDLTSRNPDIVAKRIRLELAHLRQLSSSGLFRTVGYTTPEVQRESARYTEFCKYEARGRKSAARGLRALADARDRLIWEMNLLDPGETPFEIRNVSSTDIGLVVGLLKNLPEGNTGCIVSRDGDIQRAYEFAINRRDARKRNLASRTGVYHCEEDGTIRRIGFRPIRHPGLHRVEVLEGIRYLIPDGREVAVLLEQTDAGFPRRYFVTEADGKAYFTRPQDFAHRNYNLGYPLEIERNQELGIIAIHSNDRGLIDAASHYPIEELLRILPPSLISPKAF